MVLGPTSIDSAVCRGKGQFKEQEYWGWGQIPLMGIMGDTQSPGETTSYGPNPSISCFLKIYNVYVVSLFFQLLG